MLARDASQSHRVMPSDGGSSIFKNVVVVCVPGDRLHLTGIPNSDNEHVVTYVEFHAPLLFGSSGPFERRDYKIDNRESIWPDLFPPTLYGIPTKCRQSKDKWRELES